MATADTECSLTKPHQLNVMDELGQKYLKYKDYRYDLMLVQDFANFTEYIS